MQKQTSIEKALVRKYPEQVVLVTSRAPGGKANVMAVGWVMVASGDPLMFAVGIDDQALTYANIRATRQFVVAFPSEAMARPTLFVGTHHGHDLDKFKTAGLAVQRAKRVKAPLIRDAVANFECRLVRIVTPGDCPVLFGQVVAAHVNANPRPRRLYTVAKGYKLRGVRPLGK